MSTELLVRPYTRQEAEKATQDFIYIGKNLRQMLLTLYERKAHEALGYETFELYCRDRLGAEWNDNYLRQLRLWARNERLVFQDIQTVQSVSTLTKDESSQLARLPENIRKEAYEECMDLCANGKAYRPQTFICNLKHIVTRRLKAIAPAVESAPPEDKPAPAPDPAPVVVQQPSAPPSKPKTVTNAPVAPAETPITKDTPISSLEPAEQDEQADSAMPWDKWETDLETALTWIQNQNIDGDRKTRSCVAKSLRSVATWMEWL